MTAEQEAILVVVRPLLNGLITLVFLKALAEYLWEHRQEFKDNLNRG